MRTLTLSTEQEEFASSVTATVERFGTGPAAGSDRIWTELGSLGLLGIGTRGVGGDTLDLIAGMNAAGAAGCQGPFLGAVLGARVLPDVAATIIDGSAHVSLVANGIGAWAVGASAFIELTDEVGSSDRACRRVELQASVPFETLAGEPWARVEVTPLETLAPTVRDIATVELTRAVWLVGAGRTTVERAAHHARERKQFGHAIGDFQAVAHQLAEAVAEIGAAWDAVVVAAWRLESDGDAGLAPAAAHAATRAALIAAYASHQVHGALGFTREYSLDRFSTGIRQMSVHPPSPLRRETAIVDQRDPGSTT